MKALKKIAVIGGDERSAVCANLFSESGAECAVFGMERYDGKILATRAVSCADAVSECDVLVLPLPVMGDSASICAPLSERKIALSEVLSELDKNSLIYVGNPQKCFFSALSAHKAENEIINYADLDDFAILGSVPTAEGAIVEAISATKRTISGAKVLVVGCGRVGKAMFSALKALNADVTVSARKNTDLAYISSCGVKGINTFDIGKEDIRFDIIFNTVPVMIFDRNRLSALAGEPTVIELASKPYGEGFKGQ